MSQRRCSSQTLGAFLSATLIVYTVLGCAHHIPSVHTLYPGNIQSLDVPSAVSVQALMWSGGPLFDSTRICRAIQDAVRRELLPTVATNDTALLLTVKVELSG